MEKKPTTPVSGLDTRRNFIKKAATAAAVVASARVFTPVYGQSQAPSVGVIGANNRITLGFIGLGGQGFNAHLRNCVRQAGDNNVAIAAVSDVSKTRTDKAKAEARTDKAKAEGGESCGGYVDYRKLLERKDVDAVFIATVDHWHTRCSIDALNAGKHIYVEKPLTRYLDEAFAIYDTVKRTGKILQVGSQGCSDAKWHKAAELIKAGKIGPLVLGQGSYMRNSPKGEWNYAKQDWATPEDIDWNLWMGPVHKKIPFSADHYFRWRKYYPYCAGLLGDLIPHRLHPLMLATGNPEFPKRVVCLGQTPIHSDKNTPDTPERDVPESVQLIAEFPSGLALTVTSSTVSEVGLPDIIRGHHARLEFGGNRVDLKPERPFAEEVDPETFENLTPGEGVPVHHKNWFEAIRANKQPNAGIELAIRVQTVISLAEMAERLNVTCLFDEKTRKITTDGGKELKPISYGTLPLS